MFSKKLQRSIKCKGCGRKIATVSIKPKLNRRLVIYALLIATVLEIIANVFVAVLNKIFSLGL